MTRRPVYLQRSNYRRRRLIDGMRLLPILGVILCLLPLLFVLGTPMTISNSVLYIFGIWAFLIIVAAIMSSRLRTPLDPDEQDLDL